MNNIAVLEQNNVIENIQQESFVKKAFNRLVCIIVKPTALKFTLNMVACTASLLNAKNNALSYQEALSDYIELAIYANLTDVLVTSIEELFCFGARVFFIEDQNDNNPIFKVSKRVIKIVP